MDKKVYVVAHNKRLSAIVTNKKHVWEAVKNAFETNDEQIQTGERKFKSTYFKNWWKCEEPIHTYRKTNYSSLINAFGKTENLLIIDDEDEDNRVTIQQRYLNDV